MAAAGASGGGGGPAGSQRRRRPPPAKGVIARRNRQKNTLAEIERLKEWLEAACPPRGTLGLEVKPDQPKAPAIFIGKDGKTAAKAEPQARSFTGMKQFSDMPLSQPTLAGLKASKFTTMTAVQRATLPHALCGRDVLGAAKTGSGKTLAFCIPLLERLFLEQWSGPDGLGGLIMTPTRELALQIFDELRKVGKGHSYSAGLLIGGKSVYEEKKFVIGMNVLVATPGRLLQHMDETPGFDCNNLQVLVLDEADRILDMGFSHTVNAILENLPKTRQTLLFSATQTRSVKDLARLSLKDPEYIYVHAESSNPTPLKLRQGVAICEAHEKLDMLWSFLKSHLLNKTICFLSTCKQVRFVYESFKRLRPGVPLRMLHGKMKQMKRMAVFYEFCVAKEMVLFATDIASRGLDFPSVDWVLQIDCPEDVAQYIHRVGRTARFTAAGHALMYLTPSEQAMVQQLEEANVKVSTIKINPSKLQTVTPALQALVSKSTELKDLCQRALVSYLRSVFLAPNKAVFDVTKVKIEDFSASLGLMTAPKLRFLKKAGKSSWRTPQPGDVEDEEDGDAGTRDEDGDTGTRVDPQQQRMDVAPARFKLVTEDAGDDEDFLRVKRRIGDADGPEPEPEPSGRDDQEEAIPQGKKKRKLKIKVGAHNPHASRVVFDDEGNVHNPLELLGGEEEEDDGEGGRGACQEGLEGAGLDVGVHESSGTRMKQAAQALKKRDQEDRKQEKLKKKEKKLAAKARARADAEDEDSGGAQVMLGGAGEGDESSSGEEEEEAPSLVARSDSDGSSDIGASDSSGDKEAVGRGRRGTAGVHKVAGHGKNPDDLRSMSVADQQALALQLLNKRR